MRVVLQIASAVSLALGVALIVGGTIDGPTPAPDTGRGNLGMTSYQLEQRQRTDELNRTLTRVVIGAGAGLVTLGLLGLTIPFANALVLGRKAPDPGPTA